MFVSIVLNTEYMDYESRMKWYLKNLLFCKEYGGVVVTHQCLQEHFQLFQDRIDERFLSEFEIEFFDLEELESLKQYYIPDSLFESIEGDYGSRTKALFSLLHDSSELLDDCINLIFDRISQDFPDDKIEAVFHCLDAYASIRKICARRNIPLISYVFSCFRKVHGYRQTLFSASVNRKLYCTDDCEARYNAFLSEHSDFPILTNEELIALLGKTKTLPLISLINAKPEYEIGICSEAFSLVPSVFNEICYTDDDIYYSCNNLFPRSLIRTRQHPYMLSQMQIGRDLIQDDPASFILSCKRLTAVCSQIVLKGMLWNRTTVMNKNALPFSFMCSKDYSSVDKADLRFLNYYLLGYLVPSGLMFDFSYWIWRLTNPTESEIYSKHLSFIANTLNISLDILYNNSNLRLKEILLTRVQDAGTVNELFFAEEYPIDWDATTSKIEINYDNSIPYIIWIKNGCLENSIISRFHISNMKNVTEMFFYPLFDKSSAIKISHIRLFNNASIIADLNIELPFKYYSKGDKFSVLPYICDICFDNVLIEIVWMYNNDFKGAVLSYDE